MESLPFGGVGESGMGNYHGKNSFDSFSHKKGCVIKKQAMESFNRYSIFFYIRPCFSIDQRGGTESAYFKTLQLQVICLNKKCFSILWYIIHLDV